MVIYLTHCSKEKDDRLRGTDRAASPDKLYTGAGIVSFMRRCMEKKVNWAILSDKWGVFFSDEKRGWYAKPPDTVTLEEEAAIRKEFDQKLTPFDTIYFYVRRDTYHPFYDRILKSSSLVDRITLIYDLHRIG